MIIFAALRKFVYVFFSSYHLKGLWGFRVIVFITQNLQLAFQVVFMILIISGWYFTFYKVNRLASFETESLFIFFKRISRLMLWYAKGMKAFERHKVTINTIISSDAGAYMRKVRLNNGVLAAFSTTYITH